MLLGGFSRRPRLHIGRGSPWKCCHALGEQCWLCIIEAAADRMVSLTAGPKSTQLSMLFAPRLRANCARSRGVILSLPCFPSLRISRLSRARPRSPRIAHSFSCSSSNSVVLSLSQAPAPSAASAGCWKLVLDKSSRYELANHRFSSHSYSFISEIAPDGRFAVGRRRGTAQGSGCAPVGPERRRAGVQDQPQAAFAGQGRAAPGLLFGLGSRACPVRRSCGRALGSATHGLAVPGRRSRVAPRSGAQHSALAHSHVI